MARDDMMINIQVEAPRHPIGTTFTWRKGIRNRPGGVPAAVVGFHIEHDTDTGKATIIYRIAYDFAGQAMRASVPQSIVDRAVQS
jgi:hypothetical protein